MAKLEERHKVFIVQALACFDTPSQVSAALKEEFGITVERMQIAQYNPERKAYAGMAEKLRALFYATREAFLKEAGSIPIASQSFRLRSLQRMHDLAVQRNNAALAAAILEQAAKEVGGAFTNTRQLQGPGGGPIPLQHGGKVEHLHAMTDAELEQIARGAAIPGAGSGGA